MARVPALYSAAKGACAAASAELTMSLRSHSSVRTTSQGLTLVHLSAQPEPFLVDKNTP